MQFIQLIAEHREGINKMNDVYEAVSVMGATE